MLVYREYHPFPSIARNGKVGCYVYRYRLVMEKALGRFLQPGEIVHHINGDPTDDRLENLQILSRSQHAKHHKIHEGGVKARLKKSALKKAASQQPII